MEDVTVQLKALSRAHLLRMVSKCAEAVQEPFGLELNI